MSDNERLAMRTTKADRRSSRTRRLLVQGLAEVMRGKRYHSITVQEIVDRADVADPPSTRISPTKTTCSPTASAIYSPASKPKPSNPTASTRRWDSCTTSVPSPTSTESWQKTAASPCF